MRSLPVFSELPLLAVEQSHPAPTLPCTACSLHEGVVTNCMPAAQIGLEQGPTLLVVLPPPGQFEDKQGRIVGGTTAQYVTKLLMPLWKGPIVLDYALRCAPGSRRLMPSHYDACRHHGAAVFREAAPARVLLFGTQACRAFLGDALPVDSMAKTQVLTSRGIPVGIVGHPLDACRNVLMDRQLRESVAFALQAPPKFPPEGAAFWVETKEDAEAAIEACEFAGTATVDAETFGLYLRYPHRILSLTLTPREESTAYVWSGKYLLDPDTAIPLIRFLESKDTIKSGTNIKFDKCHIQAFYDCVVQNCDEDARLLRKLGQATADAPLEVLQAFVGCYGGKESVEGYVEAGVKELRKIAKTGKIPENSVFAHTLTDDELLAAGRAVAMGEGAKTFAYAAIPPVERDVYNAADTISTDATWVYFQQESPGFALDVYNTITVDMHHACATMQFNGIRVDRNAIAELRQEMDGIIAEAEQELRGRYGEINVNSPAQVSDLLFTKLGIQSKARTATGKHSVSAEVLESLEHPAAEAILRLRQAMKIKSQYVDGMESFIRDDGRIHPEINVAGTETGRPSSSEPNLFNMPTADGIGAKCRGIFVASPGYELVEGDYNQLELRTAAFRSQDPKMMDIFLRDVDFHTETAMLVAPLLGIDPKQINKDHPIRKQAKTVNFAFLYGDSAAGIAKKLGITIQAATKLMTAILGQFSVFAAWTKSRVEFVRRNGYTTTWWDGREFRRRPLLDILSQNEDDRASAERSAYNSDIQGTGAEFMNATMGRMQRLIEAESLPAKIVLTVYDSLLSEVREDFVDEYIRIQNKVATSWNSNGVPMKMDFKRGRRWGAEMQKVEMV